jgi:hypothetical protein
MQTQSTLREKYHAPKCNCKALRIGRAKTNGWLCSHNTIGAVVKNIMDFWGAKNKLTPFDYTVNSTKWKVWIDCKKCKTSVEKNPSTVGSYTMYQCDVCYRNEHNAALARPELVQYVDDGTDLTKLACNSRQLISWKCPHCDRKWDSMMTTMFNNDNPCKRCAGLMGMTFEDFVKNSKIMHDDFYTYYPTENFLAVNQIKINCPTHGDFHQVGYNHLKGHGCSHCAKLGRVNYEIFIARSTERHKGQYKYPPIDHVFRLEDKIYIWCPSHGYFYQRAAGHMHGRACQSCGVVNAHNILRMPYSKFIAEAIVIHGEKFAYPLVAPEGFGSTFKLPIYCSIHGIFHQSAREHLNGSQCRTCAGGTSKGSDLIACILSKFGVPFEREKPYPGMIYRMSLYCDFAEIFLRRGDFTTRLIIEFDGEQHFRNLDFFKRRKDSLRLRMIRDQIKDKYAVENGFSLIRIPYNQMKNIPAIIEFFLSCPHEKQFIYTYSHYLENLKGVARDVLIFTVDCPAIDWSDID